jgi:hypothetical protein
MGSCVSQHGDVSHDHRRSIYELVEYYPLTAGIAMRKSSLASFMSEPALDELLGYCELRKFPQVCLGFTVF